jgi:hypothetical protein
MDLFLLHPHSVGLTYGEHLLFSLDLSRLFIIGSCRALVHAFFPFWFETSSHTIAHHIIQDIDHRRYLANGTYNINKL